MTQDKKDFIETILTWFRAPKVGNDEELDRRFLASAYDNITQPHWISVEDELPPRDTFFNISNIKIEDIEKYGLKDRELDTSISCLVVICGGILGLANYNYKEKAWSTACCDEVTHWMPLPQPPKEGGEK